MRARVLATLVVPLAVTAGSVVAGSRSQPAAASPHSDVRNAVSVAQVRGVHAGVAVLDTRDGTVWLGGEHSRTFSSASVVKVMIAAKLLVSGQMRGDTAKAAVEMISRSDDGAASALYGLVGGDSLINWVKAHYNVPFLGGPPSPPGRWGNTRITPRGIVHLYARLKADPKVGPWLLQAMRRSTPHGSDGQVSAFRNPGRHKGLCGQARMELLRCRRRDVQLHRLRRRRPLRRGLARRRGAAHVRYALNTDAGRDGESAAPRRSHRPAVPGARADTSTPEALQKL
jgi:hypothetical protein